MAYYHVYVRYYSPLKGSFEEIYELDLSQEELQERIVTPYLEGETFMCSGNQIDPFRTEEIRISRSEVTSDKLIPILKVENERIEMGTGISVWVSDEYEVIRHSENVTRKLIAHPPKGEKTREKPKKERELGGDVFIVHGRDHGPMNELKTMLYDFGLRPIILHEQASGGSSTLAEKLDKHAGKVGYAFVILTPEDVGGHRDEMRQKLGRDTSWLPAPRPVSVTWGFIDGILNYFEPRARQNVIFEMGYFWGLLERKRVCCLLKGNVEKPSDIEGIVYVPFKDSVEEIQVKIMKELKQAGYEIKP